MPKRNNIFLEVLHGEIPLASTIFDLEQEKKIFVHLHKNT